MSLTELLGCPMIPVRFRYHNFAILRVLSRYQSWISTDFSLLLLDSSSTATGTIALVLVLVLYCYSLFEFFGGLLPWRCLLADGCGRSQGLLSPLEEYGVPVFSSDAIMIA
jgi:hypothetical protein